MNIKICLSSLLAAFSFSVAAQSQMPPSPVAVAEVQMTSIVPTVPVSGTIHSRNDIQITSGVDGQLLFVAEPGTVLTKGDLVVQIDDTQLNLQRLEQVQLARRAKSQLTFLNKQLTRQKELISTNSTSANQLEQTESDRDVAESDLRVAELRIKQLDDQLARAKVVAPFNGVVIDRVRREGEDISRGTMIARMMDTENLEVRVFVPLKYAKRVTVGQSLEIFGYETRYPGEIRAVVPSADMRSQTFEVRVDLPTMSQQEWTPGQLVSVAVPIRNAKQTLAIPRDALILRQDGTYVFVVDQDNKAQKVAITVGDSEGNLVAVDGNLKPGDQVAIRGAESLREGQSVRITGGGGSLNAVSSPSP